MNFLRYFRTQLHVRPVTTALVSFALIELVVGFVVVVLLLEPGTRNNVLEWVVAFLGGVLSSALVGVWQSYQTSSRLNQQFNIVRTTTATGVLNIFPNRKSAAPAIREALLGAREVSILSVAGQDFLAERGDFHSAIFPGHPKYARSSVRVLLLDPLTTFALERSNRETPTGAIMALHNAVLRSASDQELLSLVDFEQSELFKQIQDSIASAQILKNAYSTNNRGDMFAVRLCEAEPHLHITKAGNDLFVEFYHLGRTPEQEEKILHVCLGGLVPVFHVDANSELGEQLSNHFEYMWERSQRRELGTGQSLLKTFPVHLADPDFIPAFIRTWAHTLLAARRPAAIAMEPVPKAQAAE